MHKETRKVNNTMGAERTDNTSLVPKYSFPATLAEQEAALETNPLLQRLLANRKRYEGDPHRPVYHYVNPENTLNDPNGLCFWQDRWHLFYQACPPEDPRQHWGHAVSDDLIHWQDLPYAIYPNPEERCYSGAALALGMTGAPVSFSQLSSNGSCETATMLPTLVP